MTKTDTLTKCYTYRREVREVCTLLNKVKEQSKQDTQPDNLENIHHLIRQQEVAITQLDLQRPNIMSMLQRGKELVKDLNAPAFVQDEVKSLERGWNETFEETVQKLRKLKSTETVWSNYREQKNEIVELLARAERELHRIPPGHYNSSNLPADLQAKQEMSVQLRENTEEMLRRLKELVGNLCKVAAPEQEAVLKDEVEEIENRLKDTLENVQEKVIFLESYNAKWSQFQNKLGELHNWTVQSAPNLLTSTLEENVPPEERVVKTNVLRSELSRKMQLLQQLEKEAEEVLPAEEVSNPEATRMKAEIVNLQEKVAALNRSVDSQAKAVVHDLQNWQVIQNNLQEVKPWIDESEVKVTMGIPKPASLEEAIALQSQAKQFGKECDLQLKKLQGISAVTQDMASKTSAPDEVDALHSRWTVINDAAAQWGQKLDRVVSNWQSFNDDAKKLETWISDREKVTATASADAPNMEKLEEELAKMKAFNNEISEQQAKLITLTQHSESLSHCLAPEGAALLKNNVQELKGKVSRMAEAARVKINELSDAILAKQEFEAKMADFSNWTDNLKGLCKNQ